MGENTDEYIFVFKFINVYPLAFIIINILSFLKFLSRILIYGIYSRIRRNYEIIIFINEGIDAVSETIYRKSLLFEVCFHCNKIIFFLSETGVLCLRSSSFFIPRIN